MGHIRIISGVLHDPGTKPGPAIIMAGHHVGNLEISVFAAWRDNCDAIRKLSGHHRRVGCIHGSGGAGASRPPEAELGLKRLFPRDGPCHVPDTCWINGGAEHEASGL